MSAVCALCFFANGCEHAVATWLSAYGVERRGASEETMAIMTSNFWTAMSAGRAGWASRAHNVKCLRTVNPAFDDALQCGRAVPRPFKVLVKFYHRARPCL